MNNINIEDNLGIVWDVLYRHFGGGSNFKFMGFEPDDLFQVGTIGLMKAVERFDPARDIKFVTYASSMIYGEIKREIRDNGRLVRFSRTVNEIANKIAKEERKDSVTIDDIVEEFEVSREYAGMVMTRLFYNTTSGDQLLSDSEGEGATSLFDTMGDETVNVEEAVLNDIDLEQRLSVLDDRERDIVELSLKGLTQKQVADIMNISQMHVSRLLRKSLKKIKIKFDSVITM
jgi:RNA polymerase sporulation-specific sigma factor